MNKNSKIIVLVVFLILLVSLILYYSLQFKSSPPSNPNDLTKTQRDAKLIEMSQSLTIQEQTPQLKAKLLEMSKSLNK